ncbi:MAG: M48 family metalloprotease [Neomegalonema sp.]|nr:M48 family metalloprotease [Neomegalonema sp.]
MPDLAFQRYPSPRPTAYHRRACDVLRRREPDLWDWFASDAVTAESIDALRLELLKSTYRMSREGAAQARELYEATDQIAEAMALGVPVTLYQGQSSRRNAALYFEPEGAHIVFEGDVLKAFTPAELRFVIGHELAHHKLWTEDEGRIWTSHRLLSWICGQPDAARSFRETARLQRLHTELYADRFGLWAVGDLESALSALVKVATGLDDVSGAAYLAQAEEALAADKEAKSGGTTHPEQYIRAAVLAEWAHSAASGEARANGLIEGRQALEQLDLIAQERVAELTTWLLREFLTPPWTDRDLIRAHARQIQPDLADLLDEPIPDLDIDQLRRAIETAHASVREYFGYLLLDFATVDPELEETLLAGALSFARDFGLSEPLRRIANKELRATMDKLTSLEKNAERMLDAAAKALRDKDRAGAKAGDAA